MSNFVSFYDYRNLPTDVIDNAIVFVQTDVGRSMYLGVGSDWKSVGPLADGLGKKSLRQPSCTSGCKALFWRAFDTDTNTLYIVNEQPNYDQVTVGPGAMYTEDTDYHIAVGDRLSIINNIRVDFVTVTEVIYGNAIKLDRTIFTTANEDTRDFRYLVIDYDKPDIGVYDYSAGAIAFGDGSKAVQTGAISFGTNTLGAGAYSTAGGRGSQAGFCAVAIGNYAKAHGTYSTAFGSETLSNGSCAFSAGSGANAIGQYSVSIGRLTNANNQSSQAFGTETITWADFSSAFGYRTSATNKSQFVIGRYNKETDSTHSNSDTVSELFIIGNGSSLARSNAMAVTNYGSIVLHDGVIGTNVYSSVVAGSTNTINASNSIIAGRFGVINSADSILVGATNDDGFTSEINANNSAAFGMGVKVRSGHRASTVTGFGTQSSNPYCLIGGLYNAGISNNLFEIGNGNKTTGSNAFAVSRTGTARLGANPVNSMDAATKYYVDTGLDGKLNKRSGSDPDLEYAYVVADGNYQELHAIGYGPGNIAQYETDGQFIVPRVPTSLGSAASKEYVDTAVVTLPAVIPGQGVSSVVSKSGVYDTDTVAGSTATGFQAVALGGMRPDKLDDPDRTPTSVEGIQSFAVGGCVHVYGDWSQAFGKDTAAYQRGSMAAGGGSQAGRTEAEFLTEFPSGKDSTGATYVDSYSYAFAFGDRVKSYARPSFAVGERTEVHGRYSLAGGLASITRGEKSITFGQNCYGNGNGSAVFCNGNTNSGENNILGGNGNNIAINCNSMLGSGNTNTITNGTVRTIFSGINNMINNVANSIIAGTNNNVQNTQNAYVNGNGNTSNNVYHGIIAGYQHSASGSGIIVTGYQNSVTHAYASVFGRNLRSSAAQQTTIGMYNADDTSALFIVANGSGNSDRKNAFTVNANGTATIQTAPINDMDVATKGYVDTAASGTKVYKHTVKFTITVSAISGFVANSGAVFYTSTSTPLTAAEILSNMGETWFPVSGYTTTGLVLMSIVNMRNLYYFSSTSQGMPLYQTISASNLSDIVDAVTEI